MELLHMLHQSLCRYIQERFYTQLHAMCKLQGYIVCVIRFICTMDNSNLEMKYNSYDLKRL